MDNETETGSFFPMFRSTWLTVFIDEYAVTSIINGFTILTFARNRHLRKRTTYLIINLTIADLLVGTVSGPMHVYHIMTFERGSGFGWGKFIVMFLDNLFTACSLLHLALLSLERLHATLFPIRHCLINAGLGLLQGRCLHLALSYHPGIRRRCFFPNYSARQQIRLGFARSSCPFHSHCLLCDDNCSKCEKRSPSILIWFSVI